MLPFTLERGLLPLELKTPAFAPLFQLPPELNDAISALCLRLAVDGFEPAAEHLANFHNEP